VVQPVTKVQQKCGEALLRAVLLNVKMLVKTAIYAGKKQLATSN